MSFFKQIKGKLLMIVMGALLLLSVASVTTTLRLNNNILEYNEVIHVSLEAQKLALSANLEFERQVQEWKNVLIRGADSKQMDKYWGRFNERHETTQDHVEKLITLLDEWPELLEEAEQFLTDHSAMQKAYAAGRDKYIAAKFKIEVGDKAVSGIDRAPSAELDHLVEKLDEIVIERSMHAETAARKNVNFSYILIVLIVAIVAVLVFILINKIICAPLADVNKSLRALAGGHLNVTSGYTSVDEIGQIADSSRQLQEFLRTNVDTMSQTSTSLSNASDHMQSMSEELQTHSSEQMHATEQVATAVQELTHSAEEVADNSQQTSDITQETSGKTNDGTNTVNSAQSRAVRLVSDLNAGGLVIKELAENAANVSSVLDVIRGIAEQTNLLALNAAIEAARAGEQGRGFAVVADEVRTLAQRTQDSTAEIEKILESVKSGADQAVIAMDKGQDSSQEVESDITAAANVLNEISTMVDEINGKNVQMATAAGEQKDVAGGISTLIQNIHELSESTQSRVEKSQQVASDLQSLVGQFEEQISRFHL